MENFWFDAKHIVSILDKNLEKIFKLYCKDFKESKELNISDIDDMENFRKDVFFVFITRKGYWLFKSLSATLEHKPEYSKYFYLKQINGKIERNYCTDRFLDKQVNLDFLVGRKKFMS